MMARLCDCGRTTEPCNHARLCRACAKKQKACPFCGKVKEALILGRLQKKLSDVLPDHRLGRRLPNKLADKLLPRIRFYTVFHSGTPCDECERHFEPLAIVEYKDDSDRTGTIRILQSVDELEKLLKKHELEEGPKAALCAAELLQAMWVARGGGLEPSELDEVKVEKGVASFEFRKGRTAAKVRVHLDEDGAFSGFEFD
jgi:hypothetical protein